MVKQAEKVGKRILSKRERATLIVCLIVLVGYILIAAILAQGLLIYTLPQLFVALLIGTVLFVGTCPKVLVYLAIALGILGVVVALYLVVGFTPYIESSPSTPTYFR